MKKLADLLVPNVVRKRLLEKDVQKQCVHWARQRGYWARKFSSQSQRSVPDYLFAWKSPVWGSEQQHKFATEFKRTGAPVDPETGCQSTAAQVEEQNAMRAAGWFVFECDRFDLFKETVLKFEAHVIPK